MFFFLFFFDFHGSIGFIFGLTGCEMLQDCVDAVQDIVEIVFMSLKLSMRTYYI